MPRIPPSVFWRARRISPFAPLLLPVCRDLASALAELRWIREQVQQKGGGDGHGDRGPSRVLVDSHADAILKRRQTLQLCRRRGRGEPLQYVLGSQPFGPLDLACRRGVLIPRPEPEAYSLFLAAQLRGSARGSTPLTVLDVCSGSGCIALLLFALLRQTSADVRVVGIDVSPAAVALARVNQTRNGLDSDNGTSSVSFYRADVFADAWLDPVLQGRPLDVLVCNPPYVSTDGFAHDTARSVRLFEPKLAQVPDDAGTRLPGQRREDRFYARLLDLAAQLDPRWVLCEVGGLDQAQRVVEMALQGGRPPLDVEIWADVPDAVDPDGPRTVVVSGRTIAVRGSGQGRSVFLRRR